MLRVEREADDILLRDLLPSILGFAKAGQATVN
jgi:hypothetical protein